MGDIEGMNMQQNSKYEIEIENFRNVFGNIKEKRIAIYGIGRRSATLLPGIKDFNIIGLLDRDDSNIGKELCEKKVININSVDSIADIVIINSDPSNYEIIYKRIAKVVKVPVYYADGTLAIMEKENTDYTHNKYWNCSYKELKDKIDVADIVSFDIFDTLIMRKIFSPEDIYRILEKKVEAQLGIKVNLAYIRSRAVSQNDSYASIDKIYETIEEQTDLTHENIENIKKLEKETDIQLCTARQDVKKLYDYCISSGKKVYLISDMYYGTKEIRDILNKCGFIVPDNISIWISCEKRADKITGSIWKKYIEAVGTNFKLLHIGDNIKGDVENPAKYGICTYYVKSGKDMLMDSSISEIASYVNTVSDSVCLGLIVEKMFNSPFALCDVKGKVSFDKNKIYGYCIYGPLFEKFLIWLYYNSRKDKVNKLLFFARDGYFLEKDYKVISDLINDNYNQETCYLPISRRLIYISTIENEDDFKRVVKFPYIGTFAEYMKSRFEITVTDDTAEYNDKYVNAVGENKKILEWIRPYKKAIFKEIENEKNNYLEFLKYNVNIEDKKCGTVDLGYYGTNQYYLQKLIGIKTKGYCFYSCLSKGNEYTKEISMKGCFQYGDDYIAERSIVKKKNMYVETFLTAPYGMIRYINKNGDLVCEPDKKSQKNFSVKEDVNDGAISFIRDYIDIYKDILVLDKKNYIESMENRKESIEDILFYNLLNGMCDISKDILMGFYFDNDFVGGKEINLEI